MSKRLSTDEIQLNITINGNRAKLELGELDRRAAKLREEMKGLKRGTEEYAAKSRELAQVKARMEALRNEVGITALSMRQLSQRARELNLLKQHLTPGTAEFKKLDAELQRINARMRELKSGSQQAGFSLKSMADGFNKYFGIVTAVSASIFGVVLGFRKLVEEFNEYQAAVSNLSALTGLAGEQLDWLSERAKAASTGATEDGVRFTNAAIDIVNAYTLIGSKRPELLANREALAAVTEEAMILSKAANIALVPAATALTTTMNQFNVSASEARRIINTLGAGSKVGAGDIPYLNAVIEKSGTSAYNAKIEIEELVGVIEGIAPKFSQPEIAGTQLRTMFVRLQSGADDVNPAIVGMEQALDNLAAKQYSVADLTKLFGLESINMALALIDSREEIKRYTAAVSDTNIAVEQAIINSDNNKTRLEQARNRAALLRMELGEKLAPALTFSTNGFSYLIKAIMGGLRFFQDNRNLILSTITALTAYTLAVNAATIAKKVHSAAIWISTKAMAAFNAVTKANPWVAITAAIIGLSTYLYRYSRQLNEVTEAQKALNNINVKATEEMDGQAAKINMLRERLENVNIALWARKEALDELKKIVPGYNASLTTEGELINNNTTAIKAYLIEFEKQVKMKAAEAELEELHRKKREADKKVEEARRIEEQTRRINQPTTDVVSGGDAGIAGQVSMYDAINNAVKEVNVSLEEQKNLQDAINVLNKEIETTSMSMKPPPAAAGGGGGNPDPDPNGDVSTAYENITKAINDARKAQAAFVAEGNFAGAKQADDVIKTLEAQKLVIDGIIANGGDVIGFLDNLTDSEENLLQETDAFNKKFLEDWKGTFDEVKTKKEQDHQDDLDRTRNRIQFELDEEARKNAEKEKLEKDWASARKQIVDDSLSAGFQMFTNHINSQYDRQMYALNQRRDAELNNENLTAEQREKIQERYRVQEAKIKEQAWKRQHRADIIQSIINTALAVSRAWSAAPGGWANLPMVVAAGISGALQTAVIASQKMPQFVKGRYNVIGKDDNKLYKDVPFMGPAKTGIYRNALVGEKGDELIIDNPTLRNIRVNFPEVMQAIHAARVPQYSQGRLPDPPAATGNQQPATNNPQPATDPALLAALNRLNDKLDQGIESYLVYQKFRKFEDKVSQTENDNVI